eukprot:6181206-Pleurochrysis_carterae.AAC.8
MAVLVCLMVAPQARLPSAEAATRNFMSGARRISLPGLVHPSEMKLTLVPCRRLDRMAGPLKWVCDPKFGGGALPRAPAAVGLRAWVRADSHAYAHSCGRTCPRKALRT